MNYKVFIPCAGIGSRLGLTYNKALTTVGHAPVIATIINKFPKTIEFVIALGYDGDNVKQVLDLLYPDRTITYVYIDPYHGKDSGLGLTLLQCKDHLQLPFIFCSCDTIVSEHISSPSLNWMGCAEINIDNDQYRTINTNGSLTYLNGRFRHTYVTEICSKHASGKYPYIGLAGIYDYEIFWNAMEDGKEIGSIEGGESYGLKHLLDHHIEARKFTWFDTGNPASLKKTREAIKSWSLDDIHANILPKDDEAIWFTKIGGSLTTTVVKFSTDSDFIRNRVIRAVDLYGYVPEIENSSQNLYTYQMQHGDILSNKLTTTNFSLLLNHLKEFWCCDPNKTTSLNEVEFQYACTQFYKEKTDKRVRQYLKTFEQIDQAEMINDIEVPSIWTVLDSIDWEWICNGVSSIRFHGDLHFENILINDRGEFTFLDWRQSFGGLFEYGDIYYDLAKLNHGILISHELIDKNLFSHKMINNSITFDFLRKNISVELEQMFKDFVVEQGYDYRKVQFLTYLIFLNIAALHHYPYGLLLFHLGKSGLWNLLEQKKEGNKHGMW